MKNPDTPSLFGFLDPPPPPAAPAPPPREPEKKQDKANPDDGPPITLPRGSYVDQVWEAMLGRGAEGATVGELAYTTGFTPSMVKTCIRSLLLGWQRIEAPAGLVRDEGDGEFRQVYVCKRFMNHAPATTPGGERKVR